MSKASRLTELSESGYNVPAFAVLKSVSDMARIKTLLDPKQRYAVRSSADIEDGHKYSFAGIFDSFLNIPFDSVPFYASKVWDYSSKARFNAYIEFCNIPLQSVGMEVLIQEMIPCEKAGVAFSQNPLSKGSDFYIEAVWGIGEHCVSGKSACDKIQTNGSKILSYEVGFQLKKAVCGKRNGLKNKKTPLLEQSKKKLSNSEISKISDLMLRLREQTEYPFEIEWGFFRDELFLFQLRPITTRKEIT